MKDTAGGDLAAAAKNSSLKNTGSFFDNQVGQNDLSEYESARLEKRDFQAQSQLIDRNSQNEDMLLEGITEDENNLLSNPPGFLDEGDDGEVLQQNFDDADNLLI